MKVLVADKIATAGVDFLREQDGFEVVEAYGSTPAEILELASDVDAIIVRSDTDVTSEVIAVASNLKAVGRAGVGVDNIDIDAATGRGVVVMNTPGGNTIATAELTFTHMLCAARPVSQASARMREGGWDRKKFSGSELNNKVLGVLGLGRIGTEVAKRAQAFNMRVLAYDPYLTVDRAQSLEVEKVELDDLFTQSDYITVHMPKTEATTNLINAEAMAKMKDGVRLLNCARGGIINQEDLLGALESGKVGAVGLDVYEDEPLAEDHPLRSVSNAVLTPHLGASTKEAQESVGIEIAEEIANVLQGGSARNAINMPSVDPRALKFLKPYLVLGHKLGNALQQIVVGVVEKIKVTYWGKVIEVDALPLTRSIQRGYLRKISGDSVNDINAPYILKNSGVECEATKSNQDSDYSDLIRVETVTQDGATFSIDGTLIGRSDSPRIVQINGRIVEASPEGTLLIIENEDVCGMVGRLGTILGEDKVNIANMALSRTEPGELALIVFELDSAPSKEGIARIEALEEIKAVNLVELS